MQITLMKQLKKEVSIRFEAQIIIHILYLGNNVSLALVASNVLLIPIVVLTINTPIIPVYPHRSTEKVVAETLF